MADAFVASVLAANPVVMFSKEDCPYCVKLQGLLGSLNIKYTLIELAEATSMTSVCR